MTRNKQAIEVVTVSDERCRRWSADEKAALVRETYEPGMSVSLVARKHGVGASQLFNWRKLEREGALTVVTAGESVVPASELAAARAQIAQLQRMLGKKTMEAEILKEAVEFAREKSGLRALPCQARTTSEAGLFCPWRSALTRFANDDSARRLGRWYAPHRRFTNLLTRSWSTHCALRSPHCRHMAIVAQALWSTVHAL